MGRAVKPAERRRYASLLITLRDENYAADDDYSSALCKHPGQEVNGDAGGYEKLKMT